MLVLTRRISETVIVRDSNDLELAILIQSIHGEKARLHFIFDRGLQVMRREMAELIRIGENQSAAASPDKRLSQTFTRRVNEQIVVGQPSQPLGVIQIVSIHDDRLRLSFDLPGDVAVS